MTDLTKIEARIVDLCEQGCLRIAEGAALAKFRGLREMLSPFVIRGIENTVLKTILDRFPDPEEG